VDCIIVQTNRRFTNSWHGQTAHEARGVGGCGYSKEVHNLSWHSGLDLHSAVGGHRQSLDDASVSFAQHLASSLRLDDPAKKHCYDSTGKKIKRPRNCFMVRAHRRTRLGLN
jgi:hypothetical protein